MCLPFVLISLEIYFYICVTWDLIFFLKWIASPPIYLMIYTFHVFQKHHCHESLLGQGKNISAIRIINCVSVY